LVALPVRLLAPGRGRKTESAIETSVSKSMLRVAISWIKAFNRPRTAAPGQRLAFNRYRLVASHQYGIGDHRGQGE
jgi:hypothetical protein